MLGPTWLRTKQEQLQEQSIGHPTLTIRVSIWPMLLNDLISDCGCLLCSQHTWTLDASRKLGWKGVKAMQYGATHMSRLAMAKTLNRSPTVRRPTAILQRPQGCGGKIFTHAERRTSLHNCQQDKRGLG